MPNLRCFRRNLVRGFVFLLLGAACSAQVTSSRYIVVDRGTVLVRTLTNTPGLNDRGDVAVWHPDKLGNTEGDLFQGDQVVTISGTKEFSLVYPADVNDSRTVVGALQAVQDIRFTRAFVWSKGELQDLPTAGGKYAAATAINRRGEIAGSSQTSAGNLHAVLWKAGRVQDIGTLQNGDYSDARDINDNGSIVGEANVTPNGKPRAFYWHDGKMHELSEVPGGSMCTAQAINNNEEVVGSCDVANGTSHGFLWRGNQRTDLGALGDDDDLPTTALDINNLGQAVGTSEIADGKLRAFIWEKGHIANLNALIPAHSGWLLLVASRINDSGEILGRGYHNGAVHNFLLIPEQERSKGGERKDQVQQSRLGAGAN